MPESSMLPLSAIVIANSTTKIKAIFVKYCQHETMFEQHHSKD